MAMRRFRKGRRRVRPRRTRRATIVRPMRALTTRTGSNPVHYFTRYSFYQAPLVSMTTNASGQIFGNMYARGLTDIYTDLAVISMPSTSDFTSLYDQYKILSYTIEIRPRYTDRSLNAGSGTTTIAVPTIYWVYDQDDVNVPANAGEIMQHPKVRSKFLNRVVMITVKNPSITAPVYRPGVAFGYETRKAPWIDLANLDVPHLGVKYFIQATPLADYTSLFDIRVKWRFAVKNPR